MVSVHLVRSGRANMIWALSINRPICLDPDLWLFWHHLFYGVISLQTSCSSHPKDEAKGGRCSPLMGSVPMETCWLFSVCVSGCIAFPFYWYPVLEVEGLLLLLILLVDYYCTRVGNAVSTDVTWSYAEGLHLGICRHFWILCICVFHVQRVSMQNWLLPA